MPVNSFTHLTPLAFLERAADVFADKTAIAYGDHRMSYSEFGAEATRLAHALRASGIEPGDRVAYMCPNIPEMLVANFGVPLAGAVLVPVNTRLSAEEVRYICDHSGAKLLVVVSPPLVGVEDGDRDRREEDEADGEEVELRQESHAHGRQVEHRRRIRGHRRRVPAQQEAKPFHQQTIGSGACRRKPSPGEAGLRTSLSSIVCAVRRVAHSTLTGILPMRACHSLGAVWCTDLPRASTATVTGMSFTSNS